MKKLNKPAVVFWILSLACMAVIFWLSSRTATQSTQQSNIFVRWLIKLFGQNPLWVFLVRKCAHFLEFTGLSLLLNAALYFTYGKPHYFHGIGIASLYAVTDEIHQIFSPGRSCEFRDWVIDTLGAILGALAFAVIMQTAVTIIKRKKQKKKNERTGI